MKEREELEQILKLIEKYKLPLSPILEYAIKEKMEEFPEEVLVMERKVDDVSAPPKTELLKEKNIIKDIEDHRRGAPWTKEEEDTLIELFKAHETYESIALQLKRTKVAVTLRLAKLGLIEKSYGVENSNNPVNKSEDSHDEAIIENDEPSFDDLEIEDVYLDAHGKVIYTSSRSSISQTNNLENDISKEDRRGTPWTENEEELITLYFEQGKDIAEIAQRVGRTEVSIKSRLGKLGLIDYVYGKEEFSENTIDRKIKDNNSSTEFGYTSFVNEYMPVTTKSAPNKTSKYGQASTPSDDVIDPIPKKRRWTLNEETKLIKFYEVGMSLRNIARILKRDITDVKEKLIKKGKIF